MSDQEEYIKQLEQAISKFLEPMKGIPFSIAIKALTGFQVLTFESSLEQNKKLIEQLSKAAQLIRKVFLLQDQTRLVIVSSLLLL